MRSRYVVNVVYMDGSKGSYNMNTLKEAKAVYRMYADDMSLFNAKFASLSIYR